MPCDNSKATSSDIEHVDWSTGSAAQCNNTRCGSQSSQASQNSGDICRICHCESDTQNPLLTPCYCSGSLKYVHQTCLQQWLTASETNFCELCKFPFIMHTKIKPLHEWRSLDISGIERRRLCCSALFHCAAALCVIWSLCVLIERAADDVQHGLIDWPFWTKLAVVTVGLTGGVIFMYIQCKAYLHLCHRWKARNRILLIQNAPEKVNPFPHASPMTQNQQEQQHHHNQQQHHQQQQQQQQLHQLQQQQQHQQQQQQNQHQYQNSERIIVSGTTGAHCALGADAIERLVIECGNNAAHRNLAGNLNNNAHNNGIGMGLAGVQDGSCMVEKIHETDSLYGHERVPYHHNHDHTHHHHHHHLHHNHVQLLHDLDHGDNDCLMGNTRSSTSNIYQGAAAANVNNSAAGMVGQHHLGQVAVSANIECSQSQHNYERDWALDDVVSQISSFRPCPQGSGSMTPFHDSIHNVLEHSTATSSCISVNEADSDNLAIDIVKTMSAPAYDKHTPTSFDATTVSETGILDNSGTTRSAIMDAAGGGSLCSSLLDDFQIQQQPSRQLQQQQQQQLSYNFKEKPQVPINANTMTTTNVRRHSDTKLLDDDVHQHQQQQQQQIYINLIDSNGLANEQMHKLLAQTAANDSTVLDIDAQRNLIYNTQGFQQYPQQYYHHHHNHQQNEHSSSKEREALSALVYDKEDAAYQCNNKQQERKYKNKQQQEQQQVLWHHQPDIHNSRRMFKSLPNLSRSHENLLRK